jgi:hypothetical protein
MIGTFLRSLSSLLNIPKRLKEWIEYPPYLPNREFIEQQIDSVNGVKSIETLLSFLNKLNITKSNFYHLMDIWPYHQEFYYRAYRKRIADAVHLRRAKIETFVGEVGTETTSI